MQTNLRKQLLDTSWGLNDRLQAASDVAKGLEHAHSRGVYHRDLYLDNVLLSGNGTRMVAKLCDFGASRLDGPTTAHYYIPPGFPAITAPEASVGLLGGDDVGEEEFVKADIFSLGLVLYNIVTRLPHRMESGLGGIWQFAARKGLLTSGVDKADRIKCIEEVAPTFESMNQPLSIPQVSDDVNTKLSELVMDSLQPDFRKRLGSIHEFRLKLDEVEALLR